MLRYHFYKCRKDIFQEKNIKRAWFPRVQTTWRYICYLIYWVLKGTWQDRCSSPSPSEITSQEKSLLLIRSVRKEEKPAGKRALLNLGNMPEFNPTENIRLIFLINHSCSKLGRRISEETEPWGLHWTGGQGCHQTESVHTPWGWKQNIWSAPSS